MIPVSIISLIIAALGVFASVYYANRSGQQNDIDRVKKEAARDAELNIKLDNIMRATSETDKKIDRMQQNLEKLEKNDVAMTHDFNALDGRMGKVESRLELLHKEFREHIAKHEAAEREV